MARPPVLLGHEPHTLVPQNARRRRVSSHREPPADVLLRLQVPRLHIEDVGPLDLTGIGRISPSTIPTLIAKIAAQGGGAATACSLTWSLSSNRRKGERITRARIVTITPVEKRP